MQLDFWGSPKEPEIPEERSDPDGLRFYQREAVECIQRDLSSCRSTLAVLATGTGKTQIFSIVAKEWPQGDVLVLAHRDELVSQARVRLEQLTRRGVDVEQAKDRAGTVGHFVVGSVDTVRSRYANLKPERFGLVIVDEAHRYVGNTYAQTIERFPNAKVLGVTATPDRLDRRAMGQVFEEVSYCYDLVDAIQDGWLVNLAYHEVSLEAVDISWVKSGRGEGGLQIGDLDQAMVPAVEGIVTETLRLAPERHGICFFPGVRSAELAAERFNALKPGSAEFISGSTPFERRRYIIDRFRRGEFQFLCNCQIATEGFDAPECDLIVQGRPTKSRALYAQMVGRGTRPEPRLLDNYPEKEQAGLRRSLIKGSRKPDCMVLDFVGNCGKHTLATLTDILGGNYSADEVEAAKKKAKKKPGADPLETLKETRSELARLAEKVARSRVKSKTRVVDPFTLIGGRRSKMTHQVNKDVRFGSHPMTDAQAAFLTKMGFPLDELELTKRTASALIQETIERQNKDLASFKQMRLLQKYGVNDTTITFKQASRGIDTIKKHGWRNVPIYKVKEAIYGKL
jgi:superfamily II DNA or RNA helicase